MRSFQPKRRFKNILHSKPILVFLSVLLLVFASGVIGFMGKMQLTIENRKIAENKVADLEKRKKELSDQTASLKTVSGIEQSIREKFPVAKEGEGLIVVVEDKNPQQNQKQESGGFFSFLFFWKNWFK